MNKGALLYLGLGFALLAGLFLWLRPAPVAAPAPSVLAAVPPQPMLPAAPVAPVAPKPQVYSVVVSKGRRVSGPERIQLHTGDAVVIEVTSDQPDELHLHGYDLHLKLLPGEPGHLSFTANLSGRFDYELHRAQLELGALEVLPQ
ncbi:MAG: hypothetical protein ACHQIO_05315 [Nevskiales bacterium]